MISDAFRAFKHRRRLARAQVEIIVEGRSARATLYLVRGDFLGIDQVGLSEVAWRRLGCPDGRTVLVRHARPMESMSAVRSKVYGHQLGDRQLEAIVRDVVAERYTDVQLATFLTAFAAQPPRLAETVALTRAMLKAGDRLSWPDGKIADKHSVGGLPANRTTPIIVAIAAAAGLTIPKTSSRAITSPAGTKRNSGPGSTKRVMSHGHAMRSTRARWRVIHFMVWSPMRGAQR